MKFVPSSRPQISKEVLIQKLKDLNLPISKKVYLVGIPGYYLNAMGVPGRNDFGIYDDAIILVSPTLYLTYNANTDPSVKRKNVAVLASGIYDYKLGMHGLSKPKWRRYKALVQANHVVVNRVDGITESGFFGINIHKGSYKSTSSLGCQTIYPSQWENFIWSVENEMGLHGQSTIPYYLLSR